MFEKPIKHRVCEELFHALKIFPHFSILANDSDNASGVSAL